MTNEPIIVVIDDDEGHAILVRENLATAGLNNRFMCCSDGQTALDFFFRCGDGPRSEPGQKYLVLLDICMPKVDGFVVLRRLKTDPDLRKIPVIMLTTTDDAREVERCHDLGCNGYIQKPIDFEKFAEAIRRLGQFMSLLLVPPMKA